MANDAFPCDFVRCSYEYMKSFGIPEIGYIPTFMGEEATDDQMGNQGAKNPLLMEAVFLETWWR